MTAPNYKNIQDEESKPLIEHSTHIHHNAKDTKNKFIEYLKPVQRRMGSLDAVRGLTIFGMILVDNQAGNDVIWPLNETEWNGLSTADLIFPSFIFISGFSIALALKNSKNTTTTWYGIIRRTLLLFFIQCFLNLMGDHFNFTTFRIMGVLQRIAICYFFSCLSFLCFPIFIQRLFLLGVTVTYISIMYGLYVPKCGRANLTQNCNAGAYIDSKVFGLNIMKESNLDGPYYNDPEGLISTMSSFITAWMGLEFGRVFTRFYKKHDFGNTDIIVRWIILVVLFMVPAISLGATVMPFNKKIWSFSFALFTVGANGSLILIAFILIDVIDWESLQLPKVRKAIDTIITPMKWIGQNPITIYSLMVFIEIILMYYINVGSNSLWIQIYEKMYLSWLKNGYLASTVFSIGWLIFFILIAYIMQRNKIFIKL
ncbi:hypothetical protein ACTFIU_009419 [Dictyostelium citrinum]